MNPSRNRLQPLPNRLRILIAAIAVLLLAGCGLWGWHDATNRPASTSPQSDSTQLPAAQQNDSLYRDEKFHFSLQYPTNYTRSPLYAISHDSSSSDMATFKVTKDQKVVFSITAYRKVAYPDKIAEIQTRPYDDTTLQDGHKAYLHREASGRAFDGMLIQTADFAYLVYSDYADPGKALTPEERNEPEWGEYSAIVDSLVIAQ